jgi:UDP:flavonoid glycosyltransferase YjiC (YdhE family)
MRVVLTTFGTTGDVFSLCLLARAVAARGHQATVLVPRHAEALASSCAIPVKTYGPDVSATLHEVLKMQAAGVSGRDGFKALVALMGREIPRAFSALCVACKDADVLISSTDPPLGLTVHETTGIPYVALCLGCPYDDSWFRAEKVAAVNGLRALFGLRPILGEGVFDPTGISPQLTLFALSRHIFPVQEDWPSHYHVTGFLLDEEEPGVLDPELAAFVNGGEPPIVVTFGSMRHEDPAAVKTSLIEAVELAGCRAVFQMNPAEVYGDGRLPPEIHHVGFTSHAWLFRRCRAAVHHGSPGTAASAFRAGIPAVFVPHAFEQFEFARYAQMQGCSPEPVPFSGMTPARMAAAIREVIGRPAYRQASEDLRDRMRDENGLRTACELVEQLVS